MAVNLLSDVDVVAISIVDKGANRKKFYLRKQAADENEFTLPSPHRLVKNQDWSTVYCVVAEPGWRENPGQGATDPTVDDEWASPDEIRLAAHKFMKNGALVNRMHETLEPYGTVVENFVAQADFPVGMEVIKAGSWVVGIEPSEEGKAKIEAGEFTGISIQGSGMRKLVEKKDPGNRGDSKKCPSCNGTVAVKRKSCQNCSYSFAKGDEVLAHEEGTLTSMEQDNESKGWLRAIGKALGVSAPEVDDAESKDQDKENNVADTSATDERLEKIEETVTKSSAQVEALANRLADLVESLAGVKKDKDEDEQDVKKQQEDLSKQLGDVEEALGSIREAVEKLASGQSSQNETHRDNVNKNDHPLSGVLFD